MKRLIAVLILLIALVSCGGESPLTAEPPSEHHIYTCPEDGACWNCHKN